MPRCVHIYDNGFQCIAEAFEATELCESHQKVVAFESDRIQESWIRKAILRFVAFVLLLMFLVPLFYSLKNIYWGAPAEAREVW